MNRERADAVGAGIMAIGACAIIGSPAIVLWQAFQWLKYGIWSDVLIRDACQWAGLEVWPTEWLGVNRIINWILDEPLWLGLLSVGLLIAWSGIGIAKVLESDQT